MLLRGAALEAGRWGARRQSQRREPEDRVLRRCTCEIGVELSSMCARPAWEGRLETPWERDKTLQGHARSWPATDGCEIRVMFDCVR